jgi:hypothetical protein
MPTITDLTALLERLAGNLPKLNLDGDEQEEYSTMLLWLQNQVETGEPSERVVQHCLNYFERFESRAA